VTSNTDIGERVRSLRLAHGMTQTELANHLGLSTNAVISRIEMGRGALDEDQIDTFARVLACDPSLLVVPPPSVLSTRPWLRSYTDARVKTLDAVLSDTGHCHEFIETLSLPRIPTSIPGFRGDANDPEDIERYAEEMRTAAQVIEGGVVGHMVRAAERLGVVVLPMEDELGRHLGLSQYIDEQPYLRVARAGIPGDRQRFTVAHELGHLGLHASTPPPTDAESARRIENQAHRFASAFLTPADPVLEQLDELGGRVTLTTLQQMKSTWGVSIKGLVVRLRQLSVIGDGQATALYKQISKRGWNKREPIAVTNENAVWLADRLERRAGGADLAGWAAETQGFGGWHIRRWLDWTGDLSTAKVVEMPTARDGDRSEHSSSASVVSLHSRR